MRRPIRHRISQFGMLFSCSVEYRATVSVPLFGQFLHALGCIRIRRRVGFYGIQARFATGLGSRRAPAQVAAYPRRVARSPLLLFVNILVNGRSLGAPALRLDNDGRPLGALGVALLGGGACPPAPASGPASSAFGLTTSQPASPRFTPTRLGLHAKHARGAAERLKGCAKPSVLPRTLYLRTSQNSPSRTLGE
jgi:hypothetical protein